jgi:hypothetical protein
VIKNFDGSLEKIGAHKIVRWRPTEIATDSELETAPEVPCHAKVLGVSVIFNARVLCGAGAANLFGVVGRGIVGENQLKI